MDLRALWLGRRGAPMGRRHVMVTHNIDAPAPQLRGALPDPVVGRGHPRREAYAAVGAGSGDASGAASTLVRGRVQVTTVPSPSALLMSSVPPTMRAR